MSSCIIFWETDPAVKGTHAERAVICHQYTDVLQTLLRAALSDPDSLSSTDRETILAGLNSPKDLMERTRFLIHELESRS